MVALKSGIVERGLNQWGKVLLGSHSFCRPHSISPGYKNVKQIKKGNFLLDCLVLVWDRKTAQLQFGPVFLEDGQTPAAEVVRSLVRLD